MKHLPNAFTLLNLFFGCIAIVYVMQNGIEVDEYNGATLELSQQMWIGSLCVAVAALVDFADGFVARLFGASSERGKQLDSLADVVSFGVVPGLMLYQLLRLSLVREEDALQTSILWLLPAFILPCAACYRLAKFNLDTRQTYAFRGTPVPSVGLTIASFPLIYWHTSRIWALELLTNKWFLYGVIALMSWLMISDIPIMSNKFKDRSFQTLLPKILLLIIAIVGASLVGWLSVSLTFVAFVVLSLLFQKQIQ
jgi:CDP-diacylglycerol---serine O-phosphatidyltransferase